MRVSLLSRIGAIGVSLIAIASVTGSAGAAQSGERITAVELGALAATVSAGPNAMNEFGQVVGYSGGVFGGGSSAVSWQNGQITSFGTGGATDVNVFGHVVGYENVDGGEPVARLWRNGQSIDLTQDRPSQANSINTWDEVVVSARPTVYDPDTKLSVWRSGKLTELPVPGAGPGSTHQSPGVINDLGQVAGSLLTPSGSYAFRCSRTSCAKLPNPPGMDPTHYVVAAAINDSGQIVGTTMARTAPAEQKAVLWSGGRVIDLGTLGGERGYVVGPRSINTFGQVVGVSQTAAGVEHAFSWRNGTMTDLGSLRGGSSYATAVNDVGDIVGFSELIENTMVAGVLWRNGKMIELPRLNDYPWCMARDVNNRGQIVGVCLDGSFRGHAVMWTVR
jgi:probable HAF family extracellular repeat protein